VIFYNSGSNLASSFGKYKFGAFEDIPHFFSKYPISDRNLGTYRCEEVGRVKSFKSARQPLQSCVSPTLVEKYCFWFLRFLAVFRENRLNMA